MKDINWDKPKGAEAAVEPWALSEDVETRFIQQEAVTIKNSMLCCARCAHIWENSTAECEIYEQKPLSVLRGGDCPDLEPR